MKMMLGRLSEDWQRVWKLSSHEWLSIVRLSDPFTFGTTLTAGSQCTYTLSLTLDAGTGFLTGEENLFSGTGTGGAVLFSLSRTTGATSTPTLQFDGVAFGYRFAESPGAASALDVNLLEITSNASVVPEPASVSLLIAGAGVCLMMCRRRSA